MSFFYGLNAVLQVGSVDEESTKSDEEYDDLAMQDGVENGYWSGDEEEAKDTVALVSEGQSSRTQRDKNRRNRDQFARTKSASVTEQLCANSSLLSDMAETARLPSPGSGSVRPRRRSLSIPALGKHGSIITEAILSGASREPGLA